MNDYLYLYIKENTMNLSKNEILIRKYILNHYGEALSTKIISEALFIAPSSVNRYLKKIKYQSIYQFNHDYKMEGNNYCETFKEIVKFKHHLLDETFACNKEEDIVNFAKVIVQARTIYIYGLGYSAYEGRNLQLRLSRIGYHAVLLNNRHDIIMQSTSKEMKDSVCIFISQTGETKELLDICQILNPYNTKRVLITNDTHSQLASQCDQVLEVPKIYSGYLLETIFSEVCVNLLFDLLYSVVLLDNYEEQLVLYNKTKQFFKLK